MENRYKTKIISYKEAATIAKRLHHDSKKIVFKTGCFDIFHIGHVRALRYCKSIGDILVVGLGSDKTLKALKGENRPVFSEKHRAELLATLECVDYVVILKEPLKGRIDHEKIISIICPTYYMLPPDDKALLLKQKIADKYGIKICLRKEMKGEFVSTTALLNKVILKNFT
ncbi:MAG: adenylyltransferase/cytidyltransferase family protein [bacterium]|nr:adenylyltransferase/cytidyltransferase family protein [bacterium]